MFSEIYFQKTTPLFLQGIDMQALSIIELIYASYTDIRYMETEPIFMLTCIIARIVELVVTDQNAVWYFAITGIVFTVFMIGCIKYSLGGADALTSALICINLGFTGIYAIITGLLISVPVLIIRKGREIPLIPFLSIGYVIWLAMTVCNA